LEVDLQIMKLSIARTVYKHVGVASVCSHDLMNVSTAQQDGVYFGGVEPLRQVSLLSALDDRIVACKREGTALCTEVTEPGYDLLSKSK
jgi:hypothetical protein